MKKNNTFLLVFFILISFDLSAQGWQWGKKMTTTPTAQSYYPVMTIDGAGNVYSAFDLAQCGPTLSGVTTHLGACNLIDSDNLAQLVISKINTAGNFKWIIGTQHTNAAAVNLTTDNNGNLYIFGVYDGTICTLGNSTMPGASMSSRSNCVYFIAKADTGGNIMWIKNVAPTLALAVWTTGMPEKHYFPQGGIHTDTMGNIYVVGTFSEPSIRIGTTTLNRSSPTSTTNIFIAKYDSAGNPLLAKSFGGAYLGINGTAGDREGDIYIAGDVGPNDTLSFGSHTIITRTSGGNYLVKIDNSGTPLWAVHSDSSAIFNQIAVDNSKNVYMVGYFRSSALIFGSAVVTNRNPGRQRAFLATFDSSGSIQWLRGTNGNGDQFGNMVAVDRCGHVWINGNSQNTDVAIDTVHFDSNTLIANDTTYTDMPMFIAEYDYSGNIINSFALPTCGLDIGTSHVMQCISVDNKGNFFISGNWGNWDQQKDYVFGSDTVGNRGSLCSSFFIAKYTYDYAGCFPLSTSQLSDNQNDITLYPNPASEKFILNFGATIFKGANLKIYDITGCLIGTYPINSENLIIPVLDFSSGIYLCKIESGELTTFKKLVVNR